MRRIISVIAVLCILLLTVSCGSEIVSHSFELKETEPDDSGKNNVAFNSDISIPDNAVNVSFAEDKAEISGDGASMDGGTFTVISSGCYVLSGVLYGNIHVVAPETENVHLVFNGVEIYSENTAAVYAETADKVKITLVDGTENAVSDGSSYVTSKGFEPNSCIFADCDLVINGGGKLVVMANCNNAVASDDDLEIISGDFDITASKNALKGKNSLTVAGGNIEIRGSKDGLKSDGVKPGQGKVFVTGGNINIICSDDAIQAEMGITVKNCKISVNAGDKIINCDTGTDIDYTCIENVK